MQELAEAVIEQLETLGDMAVWNGLLSIAQECYEKAQTLRQEVSHEQSEGDLWPSELAV